MKTEEDLQSRREEKPITAEEFYKKALQLLDSTNFLTILNVASSLLTSSRVSRIRIPEPLKELLVTEKLDNRYATIIHDLTESHEDKLYNLKHQVYSALTLLRADADFTFKINSKGADTTPVQKGQTWTLKMQIEKLYITNDANTGSIIFFLTRRVE